MISQQIQGRITGQHGSYKTRRDLAYDCGQGNSIKNTEHVWFVHAA